MYVLQLFNQYRSQFNGEERVVFQTESIIRRSGNRTKLLLRTSRGLENSLWGRSRAFVQGIYSRSAYRDIVQELRSDRPDVVHAHNLYPLFSPSALVACRDQNVPVILSVHNQVLTCPKSDHLYQGRVCQRCLGGHEYRCVLQNCRQNFLESVAYALRSMVARRRRLFHENVTTFMALSRFARDWLIRAGYEANRIEVLPNMVTVEDTAADPGHGEYVGFAGRISPEKGVTTLVAAARLLPNVPHVIAGDGPELVSLRDQGISNVQFLGQVSRDKMPSFLSKARVVVVPSTCFEMCPLVILESMALGLPVIASRIGGLPELVDDGETGLLFEPGNSADLATKVATLWNSPELCRRLGAQARQRAASEFADDVYARRLLALYQNAIERSGRFNGS